MRADFDDDGEKILKFSAGAAPFDVLRKFRNNDLILKYKESDAKGSMV